MPTDKPFQFGLRSLLLVMAAAGSLAWAIALAIRPCRSAAIEAGGHDLATTFGGLVMGIACLSCTVNVALVVPLLLVLVHTKRWLRRRRQARRQD